MADYQSFDGHGVDVANNRADDVDKKVLVYIEANSGCKVLDLGSGAGGQSIRMVQAGAQVVAVDQFDFTETFGRHRTDHGFSAEQLQFIRADILDLPQILKDQQFDVVIFQRTLHYLMYTEASRLLEYLHSITSHALYISVSGLHSLIGDTYPCASEVIEGRYCQLSNLGQEIFSIKEPVCLYDKQEFVDVLESTGWKIDECWESAFGNVKAVCTK